MKKSQRIKTTQSNRYTISIYHDLADLYKNTFYTMKYRIHKLSNFEKGKLSGPFSPMYAAKSLCLSLNEKMICLCRINFDDEHYFNLPDGGKDITHNDILVTCFEHWCVFSIDSGTNLMNYASLFYEDNEIDFKKEITYLKITEDDITKEILIKCKEICLREKEVINKYFNN